MVEEEGEGERTEGTEGTEEEEEEKDAGEVAMDAMRRKLQPCGAGRGLLLCAGGCLCGDDEM